MFRGRKVIVVMPAYNAARKIETTFREVVDQEAVVTPSRGARALAEFLGWKEDDNG